MPLQSNRCPQWQIHLGAQEFQEWRVNQNSFFLFYDGASKENPWAIGVGGIVFYPKWKEDFFCVWGMGRKLNN